MEEEDVGHKRRAFSLRGHSIGGRKEKPERVEACDIPQGAKCSPPTAAQKGEVVQSERN